MYSTSGVTPQPPASPDTMSESTNVTQSKKTTNSGSNRAASGPKLQGKLSYAAMAKKALSEERPPSAAGTNPATASGQPSRGKGPRPTDHQTAAIPGAMSRDRQAITEHRDGNQSDIELDARSRNGQPPSDVDNTQSVTVQPISSSTLSNTSASKEARATQREEITNPGPASANSMQSTSQLRPATNSPSSGNVLPSRALQETGSNVTSGPRGSEGTRERDESPFGQVGSTRERAPHAEPEQVHRTASVQPSAKPSTTSPPLLKRPSASRSPSPSPPAQAMAKMASGQMHAPRGAVTYELQAPPKGTHFESPHPPVEDGEKARSEHNPATAERSLLDHKVPSDPFASHELPVLPKHSPVMTEPLDPKTPAATPYNPPVPPKHKSAATEPRSQGHKDPPAVPDRLPVEHTSTTTYPPTLPQPPPGLDESNPLIPGNEGVGSEVEQAVGGPPLGRNERGRVIVPEERGNRGSDSANEGSTHQAYSSHRSHEYDSSSHRLPDTDDPRGKVGQFSNSSAASLDRRERPPPSASVFTQSQPYKPLPGDRQTQPRTRQQPRPQPLMSQSPTPQSPQPQQPSMAAPSMAAPGAAPGTAAPSMTSPFMTAPIMAAQASSRSNRQLLPPKIPMASPKEESFWSWSCCCCCCLLCWKWCKDCCG